MKTPNCVLKVTRALGSLIFGFFDYLSFLLSQPVGGKPKDETWEKMQPPKAWPIYNPNVRLSNLARTPCRYCGSDSINVCCFAGSGCPDQTEKKAKGDPPFRTQHPHESHSDYNAYLITRGYCLNGSTIVKLPEKR